MSANLLNVSALAVVAHWSHYVDPQEDRLEKNRFNIDYLHNENDKPEYQRDPVKRSSLLCGTLQGLRSLPVTMTILLVTNAWVNGLDGLVDEQIIVKQPRCAPDVLHPWCLPWEALRVLREWALECDPVLYHRNHCGIKPYDYFIYTEDDIKLPISTFTWFHKHVHEVHRQGYHLVVTDSKIRHRRPLGNIYKQLEFTNQTYMLLDSRNQCWWGARLMLMSRPQFRDYLDGMQWDASSSSYADMTWGIREGAFLSHVYDQRFAWRILTHLRLPVFHEHKSLESSCASNIGPQRRLLEYFVKLHELDANEGCQDAESIMFALKASFERSGRRAAVVDVGANLGNVLEKIVTLFSMRMMGCPATWPLPPSGDGCADANHKFSAYAFEPNPDTFNELRQRMRRLESTLQNCNIQLTQAAVSDGPGKTILYHNRKYDDSASLIPRNAKQSEVDVLTLDEFFRKPLIIHLLKIDAEGYDPLVLRGATRLLKRARVKFIVFEYGMNWARAAHGVSLKGAVARLYDLGYGCFLMKRAALVPLFDRWWHESYASSNWANVFCGLLENPATFDAYVAYGTNNHTRLFAQRYLLAKSEHRVHSI